MALERGNLSDVVVCAIGVTVAGITCASNKKVYVKSILAHAPLPVGIASGTANIYFVPNNGGSVGSASTLNQIATLKVFTGETVFFEPAYPLVLTATNDTVQVGSAGTAINFLFTGDQEA